jgi:hypothetical protein
VINNVTLALIADAPSVENDQECLLGLTIIISGRIIDVATRNKKHYTD